MNRFQRACLSGTALCLLALWALLSQDHQEPSANLRGADTGGLARRRLAGYRTLPEEKGRRSSWDAIAGRDRPSTSLASIPLFDPGTRRKSLGSMVEYVDAMYTAAKAAHAIHPADLMTTGAYEKLYKENELKRLRAGGFWKKGKDRFTSSKQLADKQAKYNRRHSATKKYFDGGSMRRGSLFDKLAFIEKTQTLGDFNEIVAEARAIKTGMETMGIP